MILTQLRMQNFRQHTNRVIDFRPSGCQLLVGPNGSGKSSVVHALKFALSGDLPLNKKEFITWGQRTGMVELDFVCRDGEYTLSRALNNSSAILRNRHTEESVIGHSDVSKRLAAILGTKGKLVESLLFQSQGEIDAFFRMRASDRTKYFHQLFDTDRLSKINTSLVTTINALQQHVIELPPSLMDEAMEAKSRFQQQLAQAITTKQNLQVTLINLDISKLQAELNQAMAWRIQREGILQKYPAADFATRQQVNQSRVSSLAALVSVSVANSDKAQKEIVELTAQKAQFEQNNRNYQTALAQWQRRVEAEANLQKCNSTPVAEVDPVLVDMVATQTKELEDLRTKVAKDRNVLDALESLHNTFSSTNGCCPTCGTTKVIKEDNSVQDLGELLTKTSILIADAQRSLKTLTDKIAQLQVDIYNNQQTIDNTNRTRAGQLRNRELAESAFNALKDAPNPGTPPLLSNEITEKLIKLDESLRHERGQQFKYQTEITQLNNEFAQLKEHESQYAQLTSSLEGVNFQSLENTLRVMITHKQQVDECERSIAVFTKELENVEVRIKTLTGTKAKTHRAKERIDMVESLRNIFHPTALPLEIVKRQTSALELLWNELLGALSVPFNVTINQGLEVNFDYYTANGKVSTESSSASGGQLCCAGLSLGLAAHRLFCADAGFIVLDEPTYGLDEDHVEFVGTLFDKLESYAEANKLQVFLVSHETALKDKFKSVISL